MDFNSAKDGILMFLLSGIGVYMAKQMHSLVESVGELNKKIAVIIVGMETHKEKLDEHARRLERLEDLKHESGNI